MRSQNRSVNSLNNILLVDDEPESLEMTSHFLKDRLRNTNVVGTKYPSKAIQLAIDHFFDMILIDITINYQGSPFGGLEIYNSLVGRYGGSSVLAYSKFITDDLLKQYHCDFNFIEKAASPERFVNDIVKIVSVLRKNQKCFVAMPFDSAYGKEFECIKACIEENSYTCCRIDQETFNESIVKRIFKEIRDSKMVLFLATNKNANVFYEAGYAAALNKEIITMTDSHGNLPFDIRDKNAISYDGDLAVLRTSLSRKLSDVTRQKIVSHE